MSEATLLLLTEAVIKHRRRLLGAPDGELRQKRLKPGESTVVELRRRGEEKGWWWWWKHNPAIIEARIKLLAPTPQPRIQSPLGLGSRQLNQCEDFCFFSCFVGPAPIFPDDGFFPFTKAPHFSRDRFFPFYNFTMVCGPVNPRLRS